MDLLCKSADWFLHDTEIGRYSINFNCVEIFSL